MEYPTPNPGPCRVCKKRIWHGGTECSECRTRRMRREDKADRDARAVKRLRQQLAAAKKEIDLRFRYGEFLHTCCLSGEEPKSYEWFCEIEKAAEKLHQEVFGDQKGGG